MTGFGKLYGCTADRPAYITPDGIAVWMWRKGQRVRFLTADGTQIGPEHSNVFPAVCSAAFDGWIDPENVQLSIATNREVRAKARVR